MKNLIIFVLLSFMSLFLSLKAQVPTNGLVAYYPFSGNANDLSGKGNNGTLSGATLTNDRFGNANSAYYFDGINDLVTIPHSTSLDFYNSEQTISFWVKLDAYPNDGKGHNAIYKATYPNVSGFRLIFNNFSGGSGLFYYYANQGYNTAISLNGNYKTDVPLNQFVNIVFVNTKDSLKYYINGVFDTIIATDGKIIGSSSSSLYIGGPNQPNTSTDAYFNGTLDDIRFYKRALSKAEVYELFIEGKKPVITLHPKDKTICKGKNSALLVASLGAYPFTYQWLKDGNIISGEKDSFLIIVNAQLSDAGKYSCIISNDYGADTSVEAIITVESVNPTTILGKDKVAEWETTTYSVTEQSGHTYDFSISGGNKISNTSNSVTVQWGTSAWGHIKMLETNSNGCVGDTVDFTVAIGNIIGINELLLSDEVTFYPNPVSDIIIFNKKYHVVIYSVEGKLILKDYADKVSIASLPCGLYILKMGNSYKRFIKK